MAFKKEGDEELKNFLSKVNEIDDIIKELSSDSQECHMKGIEKADEYLKKLNEEDGNSVTVFDKSQINKTQKTEMSQGDFMKSIEKDAKDRAKRKKENKVKADEWKQTGNYFYKEGKYDEAKNCYTEAIKLIPDSAIYFSNRALACLQLKEYDTVLSDSEIALKVDPRSIKCRIHRGKALTKLERYEEAISEFEEISKIDKKKTKLANDYIDEVKCLKSLREKEQKALASLKSGNKTDTQMKILIDFIMSDDCSEEQMFESMLVISGLLVQENLSTLFRISKGFEIREKKFIKRLTTLKDLSDADCEKIETLAKLLYNVASDDEENSSIIAKDEVLLNTFVDCLKRGHRTSMYIQVIRVFYQLSQFTSSRAIMKESDAVEYLIDRILELMYIGGDVAFNGMGTLNNLVLDHGFILRFQDKLSQNFVSGLIKMMEVLVSTYHTASMLKRFLPVISNSVSTVSNLFRHSEIRNMEIKPDIWVVTHDIIATYSEDLNDENKQNFVYATLGMLMNLSSEKITLGKEQCEKWVKLMDILLDFDIPKLVERTCGVLNHLLGSNEPMILALIEREMDKKLINIVKSELYAPCRKYICKCLALCGSLNPVTCKRALEMKVLPKLLQILAETNEDVIIGNAALFLSYCAKIREIALYLVNMNLIKTLLERATNDELSKHSRHNCALAIGKFALADQRYLEQLRELHGLEILHEVMKENKLV